MGSSTSGVPEVEAEIGVMLDKLSCLPARQEVSKDGGQFVEAMHSASSSCDGRCPIIRMFKGACNRALKSKVQSRTPPSACAPPLTMRAKTSTHRIQTPPQPTKIDEFKCSWDAGTPRIPRCPSCNGESLGATDYFAQGVRLHLHI